MTTAHANAGALPDTDLDATTTSQVDGGTTTTDDDEDAAMLAGFQAVHGSDDGATTTTTDTTTEGNTTDAAEGGEGGGTTDGASTTTTTGAGTTGGDDDPEIPGLGKASAVRGQLAAVEGLTKQLQQANGHIGHLKSLIQSAGKGKPVTKEQLSKVGAEFGDEFAQALADDLNAAGFGGGAVVDEETIARVAGAQAAQAIEQAEMKAERKAVGRAHPDAADYFAGGKHNAQFTAFIQSLPAERQQLVMSSWDSDVIVPVLNEFKAQRDKTANQQVRQEARVRRAVAPTQARGAASTQPQVDPMEAGYNAVAGKRLRPGQMARR